MPRHITKSNVCRNCGTSNPIEESYDDDIEFRGLLLEVEGLKRFRCEKCARTWAGPIHVDFNQNLIRAAYSRKRELVREELGLLTAAEIEKVRTLLNLTQKDASGTFGGGPNAFNKYESGEVLQSAAMDRLVRAAFLIGPSAIPLIEEAASVRVRNDEEAGRFGIRAGAISKHAGDRGAHVGVRASAVNHVGMTQYQLIANTGIIDMVNNEYLAGLYLPLTCSTTGTAVTAITIQKRFSSQIEAVSRKRVA
jgi:putative zinc finger/helix-turn-helix YgiT family protein